MLDCTLGCPKTFEYRRAELAEHAGSSSDDVSDEDVIDSFLESIAPGGIVERYLRLGVCVGVCVCVHVHILLPLHVRDVVVLFL